MNTDSNFPWFEKVTLLKCYNVRDSDKEVIYEFFRQFKNLVEIRGITEQEFNPLEAFSTIGKHVPKLSWTIPENEACRT